MRGPPRAGKTSVIKYLHKKLQTNTSVRIVNLDAEWGDDRFGSTEPRHYSDLERLTEEIVLVEIGYGNDATFRPKVWCDKLKNAGYNLSLFLLGCSEDICIKRVKQRNAGMLESYARDFWKRYQCNLEFTDFPSHAGVNQVEFNTDALSPDEISEKIRNEVGF